MPCADRTQLLILLLNLSNYIKLHIINIYKDMKKTIATIALCVLAFQLNAQTLIKGEFKKGQTATYSTNAKTSTGSPMGGGSVEATVTFNTVINVTENAGDSTILEITAKDFTVEGSEEGASQFELTKAVIGKTVKVSTDANGKLRHILNYDEVSNHMRQSLTKTVEDMFSSHPEIAQVMSKESMIEKLASAVSEEKILDAVGVKTPFDLNGQTIKNGDKQEKVTNGIKLTTTYQVAPVLKMLGVVATSKANMTEEEVKEFIISQMVENGLPDEQVEQMKANWSQMAAMGLNKLEVNDTTTYHFSQGWVQDVTSDSSINMAIANISTKTTTKLAEKNF